MVALGGEWRGKRGNNRTNKQDRVLSEVVVVVGGFSLKSVHQCSCSGLCVNIFPCPPHKWRLYKLEHCWGNRRTAEVMDWGAACLYSSGEEQGAERLTM